MIKKVNYKGRTYIIEFHSKSNYIKVNIQGQTMGLNMHKEWIRDIEKVKQYCIHLINLEYPEIEKWDGNLDD